MICHSESNVYVNTELTQGLNILLLDIWNGTVVLGENRLIKSAIWTNTVLYIL